MTFQEKLVILRKSKGLTQDEFASAVGVSRQAVYKWESGQSYPEVPKLLEMKLLFTISIDELLDDSYDIPLPEKKKRKRASKPAAPKAEPVAAKPAAPAAPKAEPVAAKPAAPAAPKAEPVAAKPVAPAAPKAEPVAAKPAAPVAPKAEPVAAKPAAPVAPKAEPVAAKPAAPAAPKAEPAAPVAPEAPKVAEPIVDTVPSPIILEDIVAEEEKKAEPAKKGFFDRLFGRK